MRSAFVAALLLVSVACAHGPASNDQALGPAPADPTAAAPPSSAAPPAPEPTNPTPLVNTLRWTTASEVENFGFDIYRATSEDGPFVKVTPEPLPGAGTVDEPTRYVWEDASIDPTRDYWYYIESISIHGERERFSPVIRAAAKQPR